MKKGLKIGDTFTNGDRTFIVKKVVADGEYVASMEGAPSIDERESLKNEIREELMRELKEQGLLDNEPAKTGKCQYCGKEYNKSGLIAHEAACKEEPGRKAELIKKAEELGISTEGKTGGDLYKEIKAK